MNNFNLQRISLASDKPKESAEFYSKLFNVEFTSFDSMGDTLYSVKQDFFTFLIIPNTIAEVQAEQSRHQFEFGVEDINALAQKVEAAGGTVEGGVQDFNGTKIANVTDPDGNTIVFTQN